VNQPDRTTPYGRLAAAASVQRFYDHRNAASDPSPGSVKRRHRGRVRSASGLWNTAVHTLERAHSAGVWDKAKSWHDVLDVTYSFWDSDCWAVREAILAVPDFALRTEASTPRLDQGAGWRDIAAWRAQALERRSDVDWLIAEGRKCSHHLARMSFGLYALTAVGSSVMAKIINDIEDAIRPLECSEWGAVSAAAHRYASNSIAPSEINISEALRLQKVQPSGRTAVLLWRLSNESTRKRLARHIAPDLKTLWGCGFGVVDVLREFLEVWDKKVPVDSFLGSRPDIPAGTLEPARIAQMTYAQAQNILERPADWPTDIVRVAVDRLGTRLSNQIPVLEVARTDEWRT
jgi:hypothetical protein